MLPPFHPLQLALGLILWSIYFVVLYSGLSLGCVYAAPPPAQGALTWLNLVLLLLTLITTSGLLWQAWRCWRWHRINRNRATAPHRFVSAVSTGIYLMAALATLAVGAPAVVLAPCV